MNTDNFETYFWKEENIENINKKLVLVIYDITDNKRRLKFVGFLEKYGIRVQKSAFEMIINTKQYDKLISEIPTYISADDNIRIYKLKISGQVVSWGSNIIEPEEVIII